MGFDLVVAFFVGLIWWEYIVFLFFSTVFGYSLKENSGISALVAVGVLALVPWSGVGSLWATITLGSFFSGLILFLIIGVVWSVVKWRIFVAKTIQEIKEFDRNRDDDNKYTAEEVKSTINNRKDVDAIAFWIIMWPFSLLGYFIGDFIYDLGITIATKISKLYEAITDSMVKGGGFK